MDRKKFVRRLIVGVAAIVVTPKIIAVVPESKQLFYPAMEEMNFSEFRKLFDEFVVTGQMVSYGTVDGNDPGAFKWHELEPTGKYAIIRSKARRKGFNHQFPIFWDEAGPFPKI